MRPSPLLAPWIRRRPGRPLSPAMLVAAVVLAGPALKLAHFLFVWPRLVGIDYASAIASTLSDSAFAEFAHVPWLRHARAFSVVAPFPLVLAMIARAWCRDRDPAMRESIGLSLLRPMQIMHARSTVWLALPLVVLLANMGGHAVERAIVRLAAPADSCLRATSRSGGMYQFIDPAQFPSGVPGVFSQWNDDIALAVVAVPGLWMLAIACATIVALKRFAAWESTLAAVAVPAVAIGIFAAARIRSGYLNWGGTFADMLPLCIMLPSILLMPLSILAWRWAARLVRSAYGAPDPPPSRRRTVLFFVALAAAIAFAAIAGSIAVLQAMHSRPTLVRID